MPNLLLTREQIVETTGTERTEHIEDLEILFLTFEEISSLENCRRLKRLCCIDNGLRKISNLTPVATTLQILCLCDQAISVVDNLFLPRLRELYLHRNQITTVGSLSGCPKLLKLWLFQNQITEISSLFSNLPELEELWIQDNQIQSLNGFQTFPRLNKLGLAGNPIRDYSELQYLSSLIFLQDLSFNDFHFGRCPIVDDLTQYKSFILLHLKQVQILDGVKLKGEHITKAEELYYVEMKDFYDSIAEIDEEYAKSLREIESDHQSRESYTQVLEKEMATALKELYGLVDEGRNIVSKEVSRNKLLLETNLKSFKQNLDKAESKAQENIEEQLYVVAENYQMTINILHLLELIENNHFKLHQELIQISSIYQEQLLPTANAAAGLSSADLLLDPQQQQQQQKLFSPSRQSSRKNLIPAIHGNGQLFAPKFAFQLVSNNTADFHLLATLIDPAMISVYNNKLITNGDAETSAGNGGRERPMSSSGTPKRLRPGAAAAAAAEKNPFLLTETDTNSNNTGGDGLDIPLLELAKLYKIAIYPRPFSINHQVQSNLLEFQRVYCLLSLTELRVLLTQGWKGLRSANTRQSQVFSNDAALLSHMMVDSELVQSLNTPSNPEGSDGNNNNNPLVYWEHSNDNLTEIMKNIIKHSLNKTNGGNGKNNQRKVTPDMIGKLFVLVSFQLSFKHTGILKATAVNMHEGGAMNQMPTSQNPLLNPILTSVQIPVHSTQRLQMIRDLENPIPLSNHNKNNNESKSASSSSSSSPPSAMRVIIVRNRSSEEVKALGSRVIPSSASNNNSQVLDDKGSSSSSMQYLHGLKPKEQSLLFSIPLESCDSCLYLDYLAVCVSHSPYSPTASEPAPSPQQHQQPVMITKNQKPYQLLKHLEAKLLALTLPSSQTDDAAGILTEFENTANEEMKSYIQRLMEGIDEQEANELQTADQDVHYREASMRTLREEIERERRGQEIQLRELKAFVSNQVATGSETNSGAGGGGGGLSHNNSSSKLRGGNRR